VALISISYLVVLVVYHFARGDTLAQKGDVRVIEWAGLVTALKSFPVIVFAYTCHQNVRSLSRFIDVANNLQMFSILNEIKDNSHRS
jgi:amino acid permease